MQTILKFGGTSISYAGGLTKVLNLVRHKLESQKQISIVISAFAGQTDKLLELATDKASRERLTAEINDFHLSFLAEVAPQASKDGVNKLINELSSEKFDGSLESIDRILSYGERLSLCILGEVFSANFKDFSVVDSRDFICTNEDFGTASIDFEKSEKKVSEIVSKTKNFITNGFIGKSANGKTTTLGRGGSDYTATFLAYASDAKEIEIYTAVDGVLTADPKRVSSAFKLPHLSYEEALELCHFGS
ncbi:MAG: aspartate kinase, partial [Rickettsiales bacterium]